MKALVFSDSHGRVRPMLDAVERIRPDVVFHLGDVFRDGAELGRAYPDLPLYQVSGNCDWGRGDPELEKVARLEGVTILYMHGHTAQVKLGIAPAVDKAAGIQADVLLFGHTHRPLQERRGRVLAVNPGAVLDGSAALLTWERGGAVTVEALRV